MKFLYMYFQVCTLSLSLYFHLAQEKIKVNSHPQQKRDCKELWICCCDWDLSILLAIRCQHSHKSVYFLFFFYFCLFQFNFLLICVENLTLLRALCNQLVWLRTTPVARILILFVFFFTVMILLQMKATRGKVYLPGPFFFFWF